MSEPRRAYLATSMAALRDLRSTGTLPAGSYEAHLPGSDDEQDEYDALQRAGHAAAERFGASVVVAADVSDGTAAVPADAVASIHVGEDLAWFATHELDDLLR